MESFQPLPRWIYQFPHGGIKTLYHMRLRFFWPGLRTDVTTWAKGCDNCLSYNIWRNCKQGIHLSWTIKIPFYIMHVNLWAPGTDLSENSVGSHLLNAMCDLKQFFVSTITRETHAEHLAKKLWRMLFSCLAWF